MQSLLVWPLFAMALLCSLVWLRLFVTRIGEMKRRQIHPQQVASSAQTSQLEDTRAADNFRNLFELPVLFYAAVLLSIYANVESISLLVLSWAFVILRFLHSYIHCTYNRVMDRFRVYLLGGIVLWVLWGMLAYLLLIK
ncbi:MAG: MAPEG family protein [Arenimonas sp.]|nr:MAPEG family protein [Arenimonas sp.]